MAETIKFDNSVASPTIVINPDDHPDEYAELMAISDLQATYENQLMHLRAGFYVQSHFSWEGHDFMADMAFVLQIKQLVGMNGSAITLLDANEEPAHISDLGMFLDKASDTYHRAINEYYTKYRVLRDAKTVEEMLKVC
jgi:hypothetical protein